MGGPMEVDGAADHECPMEVEVIEVEACEDGPTSSAQWSTASEDGASSAGQQSTATRDGASSVQAAALRGHGLGVRATFIDGPAGHFDVVAPMRARSEPPAAAARGAGPAPPGPRAGRGAEGHFDVSDSDGSLSAAREHPPPAAGEGAGAGAPQNWGREEDRIALELAISESCREAEELREPVRPPAQDGLDPQRREGGTARRGEAAAQERPPPEREERKQGFTCMIPRDRGRLEEILAHPGGLHIVAFILLVVWPRRMRARGRWRSLVARMLDVQQQQPLLDVQREQQMLDVQRLDEQRLESMLAAAADARRAEAKALEVTLSVVANLHANLVGFGILQMPHPLPQWLRTVSGSAVTWLKWLLSKGQDYVQGDVRPDFQMLLKIAIYNAEVWSVGAGVRGIGSSGPHYHILRGTAQGTPILYNAPQVPQDSTWCLSSCLIRETHPTPNLQAETSAVTRTLIESMTATATKTAQGVEVTRAEQPPGIVHPSGFDLIYIAGHFGERGAPDPTAALVSEAGWPPKLVVLNGCRTQEMAEMLYQRGVRFVVCWESLVQDDVAAVFGHTFVQLLAKIDGSPLDVTIRHAFHYANAAALERGGPSAEPSSSAQAPQAAEPAGAAEPIQAGTVVCGQRTPGSATGAASCAASTAPLPIACKKCTFENERTRSTCQMCGEPLPIACRKCTFENERTRSTCQMCGEPLPIACKKCTFENERTRSTCQMCEEPLPGRCQRRDAAQRGGQSRQRRRGGGCGGGGAAAAAAGFDQIVGHAADFAGAALGGSLAAAAAGRANPVAAGLAAAAEAASAAAAERGRAGRSRSPRRSRASRGGPGPAEEGCCLGRLLGAFGQAVLS